MSLEIFKNCLQKIAVPNQGIVGYYRYNWVLTFDCFTKKIIFNGQDPNFPSKIVGKEEAGNVVLQKDWRFDKKYRNFIVYTFSWIEVKDAKIHDPNNIPPPADIPKNVLIKDDEVEKRIGLVINCPTCYKLKPCSSSLQIVTEGNDLTVCFNQKLEEKYNLIRYPTTRIDYKNPPTEEILRTLYSLPIESKRNQAQKKLYQNILHELTKRAVLLYNCYEIKELTEDEKKTLNNPIFPEVQEYLLFNNCDSCQSDVLIALTPCDFNFKLDNSTDYINQVNARNVSLYRMPANHYLFTKSPFVEELNKANPTFSVIDDNNYNGRKDTDCKRIKVIENPPWELLNSNAYLKIEYTDTNTGLKSSVWPMKYVQNVYTSSANYFPENVLKIEQIDCHLCSKNRANLDPIKFPILIDKVIPNKFIVTPNQISIPITIEGRGFNDININQLLIGGLVGNFNGAEGDIIIDERTDTKLTIRIKLNNALRDTIKTPKTFPVQLVDVNGKPLPPNSGTLILATKPDLKVETQSFTGETKEIVDNGVKIKTVARLFKLTDFTSVKEVYVKTQNGSFLVGSNRMEIIPANNQNPISLKIFFDVSLTAQAKNLQTIEVFDGGSGFSAEVDVNNILEVYLVPVDECRGCTANKFQDILDSEKNFTTTNSNLYCILKEDEDRLHRFRDVLNGDKLYFFPSQNGLPFIVKINKNHNLLNKVTKYGLREFTIIKMNTLPNSDEKFYKEIKGLICTTGADQGLIGCP